MFKLPKSFHRQSAQKIVTDFLGKRLVRGSLRRKISGNLFQCPRCKLHYRDKKWANKCEAWCQKNKSCNIEIISHAEEMKRKKN